MEMTLHKNGWIIPAYAGSTAPFGNPSNPDPGSSPHTRGARPRSATPRTQTPDHPRIRGEHTYMPEAGFPVVGSSPHTRGARAPRCQGPSLPRIIPAYAGSTSSELASSATMRDHPRIRGEHDKLETVDPIAMGSSPHTRGALETLNLTEDVVGIIPAYAGSTTHCP